MHQGKVHSWQQLLAKTQLYRDAVTHPSSRSHASQKPDSYKNQVLIKT